MSRVLKTLGLAGLGVSLTMCNIEEDRDEVADDAVEREQRLEAAFLPPPTECTTRNETIQSGINDNFASGAVESPSPRTVLTNWANWNASVPGIRSYDGGQPGQYFAHTWYLGAPTPQHYLYAASITGRLRCRESNDELLLGFVNYPSGFEAYTKRTLPLSTVTSCSLTAAPLSFSYDLRYFPVPGGSLLEGMTSKGYLDLVVRDDSQVDYLALHMIWACRQGLPGEPLPPRGPTS